MANLVPQLTNNGIDMMTAALNGDGIIFTKICLGDGTSSDQQAMTALNHQVMEVSITEITRQANYVLVTGRYNNSDLSTGFYAKELGVYAKNANDQTATQKLYAYRYAATDVDYIPAISSGRVVDTEITIIVSVGTAASVSAIIAEGTGYASATTLNNHISATNNPHSVTKAQVGLENVVNKAPDDMEITPVATSTLDDVSSGDTLAEIAGKIKSAINFLRNHIQNRSNPHNVTPSQIGAAAASHTHTMSQLSGILPINKGGTGCNTAAALQALVRQYADSGSGMDSFTLQLGDAVLNVNGDDITVTLADMGISEAQYEETISTVTWQTGYLINTQTGALEINTDPNLYYARVDVTPGQEIRLRSWCSYSQAAYCVYNSLGEALTWETARYIANTQRQMYMTFDFTIPPGGSYMIIGNYNLWANRQLNEYSLSIRSGN